VDQKMCVEKPLSNDAKEINVGFDTAEVKQCTVQFGYVFPILLKGSFLLKKILLAGYEEGMDGLKHEHTPSIIIISMIFLFAIFKYGALQLCKGD
jgi:hypothetical protein